MEYSKLISFNDTFKSKILDVYFEIHDIIQLCCYEKNSKKCSYCFKVLCWLQDWYDDFYDYQTENPNDDFKVIKAKAAQLAEYLRNHDMFACSDDCQSWKDERLNKLVYVKLPSLIKETIEAYNIYFNK